MGHFVGGSLEHVSSVHTHRLSWVSLTCRSRVSELVSGLGLQLCMLAKFPGDGEDADPQTIL